MPTYPGTGLAKLLNPNTQKFFCKNERIGAGSKTIAFELQRAKGAFYPWGAAIEVWFSGAPGDFEIDIQGAELDQDEHYLNLGMTAAITGVNASYVGRYDLLNLFPKFVRLYIKTLTNDVLVSAVITR